MPETGRRGRPRKEDSLKVCRRINFDLSEDEYMQFLYQFEEFRRLHPKRKSITKKMFLMSSIRTACGGKGTADNRLELLQDFAKLRSDFAHVGSNVNQLAYLANTIGYAHSEKDLADRIDEMNSHLSKVEDISDRLLVLMQELVK